MKQNHCQPRWGYCIPVCCILLSSCYYGPIIPDPYIVAEARQKENVYYVPSASNVPLLTEKNDLSFSVMRASGTGFSGGEVQAAVVPWKHAGIHVSYSLGSNNNKGPLENNNNRGPDYMKYNRFEIGSGYIKKLQNGGHFETYAGIGSGKIKNSHHTGTSSINLTQFFLQPTIAISTKNQDIQFAFSSRFAGINFKVHDTLFNTDREPFSTNQLQSLYDQPFHIMWEPALVFRAGWKNVLFNFQYSISTDITNSDLYRPKNNFSIGVTFKGNTKGKTITKSEQNPTLK